MYSSLFFIIFIVLVLAELIKGLSANGTPPVLQKFSWQLDLAYFMWSNILSIRIVLVAVLVLLLVLMPSEARPPAIGGGVLLGLLWGGIYWLFNRRWVGKYKFLPITTMDFATAAQNEIKLNSQVIGVDLDGVQKAYPVNMLWYHHQLTDTVGNQPIWVTYCGLCRSGRIYDGLVDGKSLDFGLVGAITFNAIFKDHQTGSWWRQETGEAVKGPHSGKVLADIPMEQMSLQKWLSKHPDSEVLQYDPTFLKKYNFVEGVMNDPSKRPGWHAHEVPPIIISIELDGQARAYDWLQLQDVRLVNDTLGDTKLLLVCTEDGSSSYAYHRELNGVMLSFELNGDELVDTNTQSRWDIFGRCTTGELQGSQLTSIQIYQQYIRAWRSFHPESTYYDFERNIG